MFLTGIYSLCKSLMLTHLLWEGFLDNSTAIPLQEERFELKIPTTSRALTVTTLAHSNAHYVPSIFKPEDT